MDKETQKNLLELVKKNYRDVAEDFDITRKKQLRPELLNLAGMVKDGDRVLDAGCGNGRLLQALKDKKIEYLGVDSSEKLIESARKNLDSRLRGNDKWAVADVLELDKLPEKDFDYVFSIAVLHHLPGDDLRLRALKQMKNKIKPGGRLVLTVWNLWSQKKFSKLIMKYGWLRLIGLNKMDCDDILFDWKNSRGEKISRRYYHAFTKNELKKLALAAGFKIVKLNKDKYNYYAILINS